MAVWRWSGGACVLLLVVGMSTLVTVVNGETYLVGDSNGTWEVPDASNGLKYATWAASKSFNFGDEIVFNYDKTMHNVLLVNDSSYAACETGDPLNTWSSGEDVIDLSIENMTQYNFICGFPNHCTFGQKFAISVSALAPPPATPTGNLSEVPDGSPAAPLPYGSSLRSVVLLSLASAALAACTL